jgi:hypothetical protein
VGGPSAVVPSWCAPNGEAANPCIGVLLCASCAPSIGGGPITAGGNGVPKEGVPTGVAPTAGIRSPCGGIDDAWEGVPSDAPIWNGGGGTGNPCDIADG